MKPTDHKNALCRALAALQTPEEVSALLEDLCTVQETIALTQRLETARLLTEGCNYAEITRKTGVSSATISRVNRCLNYGAGGYRLALSRLEETKSDV